MGKIRNDGRANFRLTKSATAVVAGLDDLSDWDDDELLNGVRRLPDGKFPRTPKVIPRQIHEEYQKRRMVKALGELRESAFDAVKTLREIVNDEKVNPQTRITAAQAILSRTIPEKATLDIDVGVKPAFLGIIESGLVIGGTVAGDGGGKHFDYEHDAPPTLGSGEIIDVEVIEDDDPIIDPIEPGGDPIEWESPATPRHVPNRPAREYTRPKPHELAGRARISR